MTPEEQILICAVRYALGRRTYIVEDVCRYVKNQKDTLSDQCKNIIINDIEDDVEMYHRVCRTCGDDIDEKEWCGLLRVLKGEEHDRS